jgi:hypothetical protein
MVRRPKIAARCDRCGGPIRFGNAAVLIDQNTERVEDGQVVVEQSQCLLTACAYCGNSLMTYWLREDLTRGRSLLTQTQLRQAAEEGEGEVCHFCARPLHDHSYITINRSVAQLDWNVRLRMGVIVPIDSESLVILCLGCGRDLDSSWLDRYTAAPQYLGPEPGERWDRPDHCRKPDGALTFPLEADLTSGPSQLPSREGEDDESDF